MTNQTVRSDDLELASRCAQGDSRAQRELFADYRARVHGTLYRILGSNRDMEDLVQDAFFEVFRSLGSFRGDAMLSTWISRITTRVAFAYISRRKPAVSSLDAVPEQATDDPSAERHAFAREAARRLYGVLDRVEPKQRIAFTLHAMMGLPMAEVADITDSSIVAIKSRVWRARREVNRRARKDPLLATFLRGDEPFREEE